MFHIIASKKNAIAHKTIIVGGAVLGLAVVGIIANFK